MGGVVQLIAKGELKDEVEALIAAAPHAKLPKDLQVAPTKDNLEKVAAL